MSESVKSNRAAIEWFAEHAGYATPPGRMACAKSLSVAESTSKAHGWWYDWVVDDEPWDGDTRAPNYIMGCILKDAGGEPLGPSLWGIGFDEWNDPYRRVVEAELASEYLHDIASQQSDLIGSFAAVGVSLGSDQ